ncbi:MAG: hypothetical protein E6G67_00845 [Actinobacteria bacterium]|nr:MAG: hypothetical protein E6G67_00845 [Actinomycetota bacterium]
MHASSALAGSVPDAADVWNDAPGRTQKQVLQALNRATTLLDWRPRLEHEWGTRASNGVVRPPDVGPEAGSASARPPG